jgi:hypothetical protein
LTRQPNPPRLHGLRNILEGLRSHIITDHIDLAPDLSISVIGHADTARHGYSFKAGGDVDSIAEDVVFIDDDVADVNAYAELDHLILRHDSILFGHAALDFNCAAHSINGAGKLDQQTVAGRLDNAAAMLGERGVYEGFSDCLEHP